MRPTHGAAQPGTSFAASSNDLRPYLEDSGDWAMVSELCEATLARGSSADRQRLAVTESGNLRDATQMVVDETAGRSQPAPSRLPSVAAYPTTDSDEAVLFGGFLARSYGPLLRTLDAMGAEEAHRREADMREKAESLGMTFGVTGGHRAFPIDALPRVVASYEWESLVEGLTQRARAIEHFLRDIYGPAHIVHEGVMTEAFVRARPGYRPEAANLPADTIRAAVCGFDLVRDPLGGWRVIEDNVRTPSGLGYAIGLRRLVAESFPEFSEGVPLRQPDDVMGLLGDTLRACSEKDDPLIVLVSEGSHSSAWFEHRMLAEEAGLLLVTPSELGVDGRDSHCSRPARGRALPPVERRARGPDGSRGRAAGQCASLRRRRAAACRWSTRRAMEWRTTRPCTAMYRT